jgi:uncharacterized protein (DUF302 family)
MIRQFAATALSIMLLAGAAHADPGLVVTPSKLPVKETLDAMTKALEAKGIKVVARVDHAAGAKAAGMELRPAEVLIFGNPKLGTPLMQANPQIGIDLPMKAYAWQDAAGKVFVAYTAPDALKARYAIKDKDEVFKAMAGALAAFTAEATGGK